jgi:hypothetical protein
MMTVASQRTTKGSDRRLLEPSNLLTLTEILRITVTFDYEIQRAAN